MSRVGVATGARVLGASVSPPPQVRWLLGLSAACLVVRVSLTDYGPDDRTAGTPWVLLGLTMLWLIYRLRSRVARGVIVVTSLTGAVACALAAFTSGHAALLAILFAGQALPLLTRPVRNHVHNTDAK